MWLDRFAIFFDQDAGADVIGAELQSDLQTLDAGGEPTD